METVRKQQVYTLSTAQGCLTNLMETTSIRRSLQDTHYEAVGDADLADVIIINTCGYNQEAENYSLSTIEDLQARYPQKKVIVTGCLPRINKDRLEKKFSGPIVSTGELEKLNQHFEHPLTLVDQLKIEASSLDETDLNTRLPSNIWAERLAPILAWSHRHFNFPNRKIVNIFESMLFDPKTFAISVSRGCLGKCNYCAIKKAKGRLVSRPLPEIVGKIRAALEGGYTRIHLLADDVGCWGQDLNLNSAHLLSAIFQLPFEFQLTVHYFDPTWLTKLYKDLRVPLADARLICLNVPMQSGNNQMLKAMDRDYQVEDATKCLTDIKKRNPNLALKTHIMIGYPGETGRQFMDSVKILNIFDLIYPNKYGPRPGTPAEKLQQLPERIKTWRFSVLKISIHLQHLFVFIRSFVPSGKPL